MWKFLRSLWRSSVRRSSSLRYRFKIPDPSKPIGGEPPPWGPFCELIDFEPQLLTAERVLGRVVSRICTCVGTYGMGGPGFFGLRFGEEWLVIAIWGASSWIQVDGRIVEDVFWEKNDAPRPWITAERDELTTSLIGQSVSSYDIGQYSLRICIGKHTLSICESSDARPVHEGNKSPRRFEKNDDLRKAIFLSPTTELWI